MNLFPPPPGSRFRRQTGPCRPDRRRQVRLDVFWLRCRTHRGWRCRSSSTSTATARAKPAARSAGMPRASPLTVFTDDGARAIAGGAMDVVVEATGNPGRRHQAMRAPRSRRASIS